MRSLIRLALESAGYKVLEMEDPESALAICANYDGPLHLLLTDVVMPKMSGRLVAEKVISLRPDIKVLYMSGYTDDAIVHHGVLGHDMPFIQKPFSPTASAPKDSRSLGREVKVRLPSYRYQHFPQRDYLPRNATIMPLPMTGFRQVTIFRHITRPPIPAVFASMP